MELIKWNNSFSVGITQMDDQHQKLIKILNELNDQIMDGKGMEIMQKTFDNLMQYTLTHFQDEEHLMMAYGFSQYHAHKDEHRKFIKKVEEFKVKFISGNTTMENEVLNFLKGWLVDHICGSDQKYSNHIKAKGVK